MRTPPHWWRPALLLLLLGILWAVHTLRERARWAAAPVFNVPLRGFPLWISVGEGKPFKATITAKGYAAADALLPPNSPPLTDRETLTLLRAAARHARGKSSRAGFDQERDRILAGARTRQEAR